jgi:hypothetical protein
MSDSLRNQVVLTSFTSERIKSRLVAGYNAKGDLVLEGYDVGQTVEEMWGDGDYEYWVTVDSASVPRLATALAVELQSVPSPGKDLEIALLEDLQSAFDKKAGTPRFANSSAFMKWLEERNIVSAFERWI